MSGFYYKVNLVDLDLTATQLVKVRDHIRSKIRSIAAIDSGLFLRSLKTKWDKKTKILTVYSALPYSGYVEGGTMNYRHHKDKVKNALSGMGLKPSQRKYF